ncbi:transcriptional coactivator/pterin dehydratase [Rhexocercosporidium sp. MPI-PUGE-AT-0058]|nr:transcriptional coactivator/pterin dehydratase [Rhexocercosporidium sp. MPI-PUGE-AT-0058]
MKYSITCKSRDPLSLATPNLIHPPTHPHHRTINHLPTHHNHHTFRQLKMRPPTSIPLSLSLKLLHPIPHIPPTQYSILKHKYSTSTCRMSSPSTSPKPAFSSTYPASQGTADLSPLLKSNGGRWTLIQSGKGVERGFRFKTFKKTWEFMNLVASECAVQKHHPEWSNVYNTTFIRWTTHSPPGLSGKDILMARFCDEKGVGELEL